MLQYHVPLHKFKAVGASLSVTNVRIGIAQFMLFWKCPYYQIGVSLLGYFGLAIISSA